MAVQSKRSKRFYATLFLYGDALTICTRHKTRCAAKRAARECEQRGGMDHKLWMIVEENLPHRKPKGGS